MPDEFIRRFLIHVLPSGFHRIRHYGLFANPARAANLAKARALLQAPPPSAADASAEPEAAAKPPIACPSCGGRMVLVEVFERGGAPRGARRRGPCSGSTPHEAERPPHLEPQKQDVLQRTRPACNIAR